MKVLLVNGSPHEKGCTNRALEEVQKTLIKNGVEAEIYWIGREPISGCLGCGACRKTGGNCVINSDKVNEFTEKAKTADGFIFGSPVHYASAGGAIISFMDRAFYSGAAALRYKPAAAVVSCRRAGGTATFDVINKYFTICSMPIVSSNYWNEVHGSRAEDVQQDIEGLQTMRVLGYNMAWLLKCIELGKGAGIEPEKENKIYTNFVR
ncbi:MAG: flavodoxin family protein [Clostridia bacterium]|nr:flavodoxin family protein [Clostridia bacterium]